MSSETPWSSSERDPTLYLRDMVEFCNRVVAYTAGFDAPMLLADRMRYDATLRNLELIGEAATRAPAGLRERALNPPWRLIIGTRNRLAHGYLGIEPETVWLIATDKHPASTKSVEDFIGVFDLMPPLPHPSSCR